MLVTVYKMPALSKEPFSIRRDSKNQPFGCKTTRTLTSKEELNPKSFWVEDPFARLYFPVPPVMARSIGNDFIWAM